MIPLLNSPESLTAFGDSRADAVDTVMDLLTNRRRRAVLQYLEANDGSATLTELAVEIAAQETGSDPNAISDHGTVSAERATGRSDLASPHAYPKIGGHGGHRLRYRDGNGCAPRSRTGAALPTRSR